MMNKAVSVAIRWPFSTSGSGRIANFRGSSLPFLLSCLWLFGGLLFASGPAQAKTKAGDILIVDGVGGTDGRGALFLVDPKTGQRTVLSDFGNPAQGSLGAAPASVAVGSAGRLFVTDIFAGGPALGGALFEVDPDTGNRTLLSNFGQGDIQGIFYYGLAVDAKGKLIATQGDNVNTLVRIDPKTDKRMLLTDLTNPAQGETEADRFITDLALEGSGKILIGTARGSGQPDSAIFRVHPETGKRTLLSDFANATQGAAVADLFFSTGLAIETSGQILAASGGSFAAPRNLLLRIDPKTGQRKVLSDFDNPAQGHTGGSLHGVAVEKSGKILVSARSDPFAEPISLFRIDPKTGQRTVLSDSHNPAQGPALLAVTYIAVVPKASDAEDDD